MADPLRIFRKLAQNNLFANQRLHLACAQLRPGEFEAPRTAFFPSIRATLNHILIVDHFYIDAMEGGTLGLAAFAVAEPCRTVEALTRAQSAEDARLLRLVEALTPSALEAEVHVHRGSRVQTDRMDDVLSHLFQHQTHHRGQAHAILSGSSVAPPQLDEFIVGDDAPARVADLERLGWTEQDLMR